MDPDVCHRGGGRTGVRRGCTGPRAREVGDDGEGLELAERLLRQLEEDAWLRLDEPPREPRRVEELAHRQLGVSDIERAAEHEPGTVAECAERALERVASLNPAFVLDEESVLGEIKAQLAKLKRNLVRQS